MPDGVEKTAGVCQIWYKVNALPWRRTSCPNHLVQYQENGSRYANLARLDETLTLIILYVAIGAGC
jgi:hypothetical protein